MTSRLLLLLAFCGAFLSVPAVAQDKVTFQDNWGPPGFSVVSQSPQGMEIIYSVPYIDFQEIQVDRQLLTKVLLPGALLGNNQGAPDLPGIGRFIAFPKGAQVTVDVLDSRSQVFENMELLPAPAIQRENDDSPPVYEKDPVIYGQDAYYPAEPVMHSTPRVLRGVDTVILGVTPFAYNPVQKQLVVYHDLRIRVRYQGGSGYFGDDAYRSRWFEPMLKQHLLNYTSLPAMNFNANQNMALGSRGSEDECEYMIFVPDDPTYEAWAEVIKAFRVKQGISTNIFNISDYGGTASGIESHINFAYKNWFTKPVAVLLLGDYPTMPTHTWNGYCLSDNMYADCDNDDLPDLNVARLTARNGQDLDLMINKFIGYETNPPTSAGFYDEPIMAGGWQTERWFVLCTEVCRGYIRNVLGKNPVREYANYSGWPSSVWSTNQNTSMIINYFGPSGLGYIPSTPGSLPMDATAARINSDINSGAFYMLHRDHGYEQGWGEPNYSTSDLGGLHNEDLCFVLSINCLTGKYDENPECFTEAFHRMQYGALGLIAASHISYSFVNDTFIWGLHDSMWPDFDPGYGGSTGDHMYMPGFAQASGKLYLAASNWPYNTSNKDETNNLFHMHGDAFMQLYTEVPQSLTVSHGTTISTTDTSFVVTADAGSLIALSTEGRVLGTADGTGGPVTVSIVPPQTPGVMYVTVTKTNHYRYEDQVAIVMNGPLAIWPPEGTPSSCLPGPTSDCKVRIVDGLETYVPGTGKLHYRFAPGDPYAELDLAAISGNDYLATLPGARPDSLPQFYFSAQGDGGSTVYSPADAPNTVYAMTLEGLPEVLLYEDFEGAPNWNVTNTSISTGAWECVDPTSTDAQPGNDHTPDGVCCYITDGRGGGIGDYDVDGGPTRLFTPVIDLSSGDAEISFYLWFYHSDNGTQEPFEIAISNNGGSNWTKVADVGHSPGWNLRSFLVSDHVTPTSQVMLRFSAEDNPNDSVVEAALDDFLVSRINMSPTLWSSAYDFSVTTGAVVEFSLDAEAANANREYLLLGSVTGTVPGTPLPGGTTLPLNWDLATKIIMAALNTPVFQQFHGTLDGMGEATATLDTQGALDPALAGIDMYFAYFCNPTPFFASNPVTIAFQP